MITVLQSPFFIEIILPFLLVFVIIFAILEKAKIFGDGKRQIDALVGLIIGLIVVAFGNATGIILSLMPFLAVSVVIILVFMILYGMVFREGEFEISKGLRIGFGILIGIAVVVAVLVSTGGWDYIIENWVYGGNGGDIFMNIIFIAIIAGAVAAVLSGSKKESEKD